MNGANDPTQPDWNTNPQKPVAFCQHCGKSLDNDSVRRVGPAVYCEPCLAARLAGSAPHPGSAPPKPGYGPVYAGGPGNGVPFGVPVAGSNDPNPGLAALLGLIPGVGAMYNEQYAKGVAHLLIFAILVMFSHVSGIFGLFVMGWICYMSIEAHHTAKARRDRTPLPNPFGLNDIGERMGFGRAWPAGPDFASAARDAAEAAAAGIGAATAGFGRTGTSTPPPPTQAAGATWGAPVDAYANPASSSAPNHGPSYGQPYSQPYNRPYTQPSGQPYSQPYTNPIPPYNAAYAPVPPVVPPTASPTAPPIVPPVNRFPAGAVWLIGLGMFFLLSTLGIFHAVPVSSLLGVVLLVLGAWTFLRRMTCTGESLTYDGTPTYNLRVLRALRGSVWLILIGILALLDSFRLVSWHYSWPWIIIMVGVMLLLERTVYNYAASAAVPPASPAYVEGWDPPPVPSSPSAAASSSSSAIHPDAHEGGL